MGSVFLYIISVAINRHVPGESFEVEYGLVKAEARGKLKRMLKEPRRDVLKKLIDQVTAAHNVRTAENFVPALKELKIDVRIHTNAEGRAFGITFYDPRLRPPLREVNSENRTASTP